MKQVVLKSFDSFGLGFFEICIVVIPKTIDILHILGGHCLDSIWRGVVSYQGQRVRQGHSWMPACTSAPSPATGYSPLPCALSADRSVNFFKSNLEQKDTTHNRNSPDALTSVIFFNFNVRYQFLFVGTVSALVVVTGPINKITYYSLLHFIRKFFSKLKCLFIEHSVRAKT